MQNKHLLVNIKEKVIKNLTEVGQQFVKRKYIQRRDIMILYKRYDIVYLVDITELFQLLYLPFVLICFRGIRSSSEDTFFMSSGG